MGARSDVPASDIPRLERDPARRELPRVRRSDVPVLMRCVALIGALTVVLAAEPTLAAPPGGTAGAIRVLHADALNEPAPAFSLVDRAGAKLVSGDLLGHPVV